MKVIILCGGVGTRLKEETEFKPKSMVYVGNKPIILRNREDGERVCGF